MDQGGGAQKTPGGTGDYGLRLVVTDNAGNVFVSDPITVTVGGTSATVTLADPGTPLSGTVSLSASKEQTPYYERFGFETVSESEHAVTMLTHL